jgi:hypothetical protein
LTPFDRLRGGLLEEQRNDLDQAAEGDHDQQDQHDHQEVVGLDLSCEKPVKLLFWPCCSSSSGVGRTAGMAT